MHNDPIVSRSLPKLRGAAAALVLLTTACGGSKGPPARPPVPVAVATVERGPAPYLVTADGSVEPLQTVSVEPQVGGVLTSVDFTEGQEVQKGDPLFHIDPRPYEATLSQAEANLARDLAQAANSQRDAERYQKLAAQDYVTQSQADAATATADAQAAVVKADSAAVETARLNLAYTVIHAPISGRTGSLLVRRGNLVRANSATPLVVINQIRPILVRFSIPGRDLPLIQKYGAHDSLKVIVEPVEGDSTSDETGTLTFIDNAVDPQTGTVLLKARFANADEALWPNEYVRARLQLYVEQNAVIIPSSAPVTEQNGSFVFVIDSAGKAERRTVVIARSLDDHVVVASGLEPGERVVTDGQSRLYPGSSLLIKGQAAAADSGRAGTGQGGRP
jgi:multidrug efflux system membrane fusion protein